MEVVIRERKKSAGVPKVKASDPYIGHVKDCLVQFGFEPSAVEDQLSKCILAGYYESTMSQQAEIMTHLLLNMCQSEKRSKELIQHLYTSKISRIRCRIPMMIYHVYEKEPMRTLEELCIIADDADTGPRENAQGAIRHLLIKQGPSFLTHVLALSDSTNPNIRRACVEATRPRGVWVSHISSLKSQPEMIHCLLDKLIVDESDYVKTAVANSINDIAKDHAQMAIDWCVQWKNIHEDKASGVIGKGLRWLKKKLHPQVFSLLEYNMPENFSLKVHEEDLGIVVVNQVLSLSCELKYSSTLKHRICVQYVMTKPNGRSKTYEGGEYTLLPDQTCLDINKMHHIYDTCNHTLKNGEYSICWYVCGRHYATQKYIFQR